MAKHTPVRKTVSSQIYANQVYPKMESPKSATAEYINILLGDDEALNLARHLIQSARESTELTIRVARKPAVKTSKHSVSVTYECRKKKRRV